MKIGLKCGESVFETWFNAKGRAARYYPDARNSIEQVQHRSACQLQYAFYRFGASHFDFHFHLGLEDPLDQRFEPLSVSGGEG